MLLFAKRYCLALSTLLVAMCLYLVIVVPAIEPPPRAEVPLPNFETALAGEQWWQPLFAANAWEIDNPQIFQSKRGVVLLSQEMVQEDARTMHLKPLTMIIPQTNAREAAEGVRDVLIVSAELGAIIHFDEDIDQSGSVPSIERGVLKGLIQIVREVQGKPNDNPWSLRTSDLSLDRSRISTPKSVVIQWSDGIIEGHDMKLALQGDLLGGANKDSNPWGPLRTLELYHLDRMQMTLDNGGLWSQMKTNQLPNQPNLSQLPASLQVACGGRFTFDFNKSQATLVNGVRVVHQLGSLPPDEFLSQDVNISLEPPDRKQHAAATTSSKRIHGIRIKEFEAKGVDSLENFVGEQKVEIRAPNIGAFASAKRLRFNLQENRIELDGKLTHPGATQSVVWLKYQGYEFTAPRIDYDADGNSSLNSEHLGYLIASGAGQARMPAESTVGSTLIRWKESLEMRPTEIAGQQWLGLFGNVLVESEDLGYMATDELEVWLRKPADLPANPKPASGPGVGARFLPERLRAMGNVNLSTPQIKAKVAELGLAINFLSQPDPNAVDQSTVALSDSAGRPMYSWVQPPASTNSLGNSSPAIAGSFPAAKPQSPSLTNSMTVVGRSLDSTIFVAGNESWIDNLTVTGPLQVNAETLGTPGPAASQAGWQVVGDELQMATNKTGQVDLQITGQPARITLAEGSLEGPTIRFDQKSNLIWMDQPGEFTLPTSTLANPSNRPTTALNWFEPPHCKWQGRMLFDGKTVRIEGDIRFNSAVAIDREQYWWINGSAEVLEFELSDAVDLDDLKSNTARPHKITVSQNVNILASQKDIRGELKSRQQLQLPSLSFEVLTHEIIGLGPGSIRTWYVSKSTLGQMASHGNSLHSNNLHSNNLHGNNLHGAGEPQGELQGAHLVFRDSMRGFMDHSELYFQGKVELATGPLSRWEDSIDLAQMQKLSLNQLRLFCDLLKVFDTSGLSTTNSNLVIGTGAGSTTKAWEFQAKGNVEFAGKAETTDYEGNGSEIAYVQAKQLLTLLGEPRRPARIILTPSNGGQRVQASVESAAINPRTGALEGYKPGQEGIQVDLQGNSGGVSDSTNSQPNTAVPNPRGTVSDFLRNR